MSADPRLDLPEAIALIAEGGCPVIAPEDSRARPDCGPDIYDEMVWAAFEAEYAELVDRDGECAS